MGIVDEFQALKAETDADLLAMQVGDFYEFFAADARTVASVLDLQVSEKSNHGSSYPMAGVPVDDLTPYLAALVERGYRVAVAEQSETDAGDIEREIERVVTPGTLLASTDADPRYLAAVVREAGGDWGLAFVDVTTGQFRVTRGADRADAVTELYRFAPAEVLPGPALRGDDDFLGVLRERTDATLTLHDAGAFDAGRATHRVREQFGDGVIESLGVAADGPVVRAAGAAVGYIAAADEGVLASVSRIQPFGGGDHVELDATTQRNLELTETM
ncbi:DNA mismatch repair protein MutS, partial [Halobacterium salinarum]|nr:DNA mismatch repair protein MutS [Halobacterium salinarum]